MATFFRSGSGVADAEPASTSVMPHAGHTPGARNVIVSHGAPHGGHLYRFAPSAAAGVTNATTATSNASAASGAARIRASIFIESSFRRRGYRPGSRYF